MGFLRSHSPMKDDTSRIPKRYSILGCGLTAFVVAVLIGATLFLLFLFSRKGFATTPTIYQSDKPVTVAQAREKLAEVLPLPDSAKNVQYALL